MASPHGAHPASSASPHASPDGNAGDPLAGDPLAGDEDDDDEDTVMAFYRSKDRLGAAWYGSAEGSGGVAAWVVAAMGEEYVG